MNELLEKVQRELVRYEHPLFTFGARAVSGASYPLELGAGVGFATAPIRGAVNPFGAGFGARIGYAFSSVYVGATATYYLGGSDVGASDQALEAIR